MAALHLFTLEAARRTIREYKAGARLALLCVDCSSVLMPTGKPNAFTCPQGHGRLVELRGRLAKEQREAWRHWIEAELILKTEVN